MYADSTTHKKHTENTKTANANRPNEYETHKAGGAPATDIFISGDLEINSEHYNNANVMVSDTLYCSLVQEILQQLGPFNFNKPLNDGVDRVQRPLLMLENGAKYEGEWIKDTDIRDGRGIQIWLDGSRYEGYWKNNKANGLGRLIHADGDIYEGDWKDDKAHGNGVYTHTDGSRYEGQWREDK